MAWIGVITNNGNDLLTRWVEGKTLTVTRAAAGQGRVDPATMLGQTALVEEKQEASIVSNETVEKGQRLKLQVTAQGAAGYSLNQFGVWARLEGEEEKLIALFQTDTDIGVEIPSKEAMPDFVYTFYGLLAFSNQGTLEVTISAASVVTAETLAEALTAAMTEHNADPDAHGGAVGGAKAAVLEITIPKEGWAAVSSGPTGDDTGETGDSEEGGGLYVDVPIEGVSAELYPLLSIHPAGMETARLCGFSTSVRTVGGGIRAYAQTQPAADIRATLALFGQTGDIPAGGGTGTPTTGVGKGLTVTLDGKIAVKAGDGLTFDENGAVTVAADALSAQTAEALAAALSAPDEAVEAMVDEVYR